MCVVLFRIPEKLKLSPPVDGMFITISLVVLFSLILTCSTQECEYTRTYMYHLQQAESISTSLSIPMKKTRWLDQYST